MVNRMSVVIAATLLGAPALAQDGQVMLKVETGGEHGPYLTDTEGRALYLFEADRRGEGSAIALSDCYDVCAIAWPPLLGAATDVEAGEQIQAELIGSIQRKDGSAQITYGGWPLYYYAADANPGDTKGQDVAEFGAEWYLVAPTGEKVDED